MIQKTINPLPFTNGSFSSQKRVGSEIAGVSININFYGNIQTNFAPEILMISTQTMHRFHRQ